MGQEFHFWDNKITDFHFFIRVRRLWSKTASQNHDLVSNDPILDSKVVPDELGQLGRPAERAGRAWPARAGQPGGRASPAGRPGCLAGRWAASREGNEGRAQEGAQRAGAEAGRRLGGVWKASGRRPRAAWERFAGRLGDVWAHTGGRSWRRRRAQVRRAVVVVGRGGAAGGVAPGSQRFPREGSLH